MDGINKYEIVLEPVGNNQFLGFSGLGAGERIGEEVFYMIQIKFFW